MDPVVRFDCLTAEQHPPYEDPELKALLAWVFRSPDGKFVATYWKVESEGELREGPEADELICVLAGRATVETGDETYMATAGDVILWTKENTPLVRVEKEWEAGKGRRKLPPANLPNWFTRQMNWRGLRQAGSPNAHSEAAP